MSPRAACRLAQLGWTAYDYAAGKADWLAFGLPHEGSAQLISGLVTDDVPTCQPGETLGGVCDRPTRCDPAAAGRGRGRLLTRCLPGVSNIQPSPAAPRPDDLLIPLHLRFGRVELRLFTTIATVGAAHDITLEELRIESLLPVDHATDDALRSLAE